MAAASMPTAESNCHCKKSGTKGLPGKGQQRPARIARQQRGRINRPHQRAPRRARQFHRHVRRNGSRHFTAIDEGAKAAQNRYSQSPAQFGGGFGKGRSGTGLFRRNRPHDQSRGERDHRRKSRPRK